MNNADNERAADGGKAAPKLYPRLHPEPATGEPWRPVMTEQARQEHERYVKENNLPF